MALNLTSPQVATLKAALLAETDPTFVLYRTRGQNTLMAAWLNGPAAPTFIVFKRRVTTTEVGAAVSYIAVEAMTDADRGKITTFYSMNPSVFDPSRADVRTYWANTFAGALGGQGQASRDALDALWRRQATELEVVFATGTGSTLSPGTLVVEGPITDTEVAAVLAS